MRFPPFVFKLFVQKIKLTRPHVARALLKHEADLLVVADTRRSDEARIDALRRAGASTIKFALKEPWPTGSSFAEQRLRTDLRLLRDVMALAIDLERPEWYREFALATAHGIGLVIAAGLSGQKSPGNLDLHIWRACGTRNVPQSCDDALCRLCEEHDRARGAINEAESRENWEAAGKAAVLLLLVGIGGGIAAAASRK